MSMGTRPAFNSAQPTLKRNRKETGPIHLQGPPQTKHTRLPARRVFFETTTPTELIAHSRGEHAEICEGVEKLIITKEQRKGVRSHHTIQDGPNRPLCSIQVGDPPTARAAADPLSILNKPNAHQKQFLSMLPIGDVAHLPQRTVRQISLELTRMTCAQIEDCYSILRQGGFISQPPAASDVQRCCVALRTLNSSDTSIGTSQAKLNKDALAADTDVAHHLSPNFSDPEDAAEISKSRVIYFASCEKREKGEWGSSDASMMRRQNGLPRFRIQPMRLSVIALQV
ncbi:hypothetical protein B0H13DRAFT_1929453 [Mycena leptocephala]|nr:hypothetical protein B0H13DRAFT_1929453 [Mycena leptocephala]